MTGCDRDTCPASPCRLSMPWRHALRSFWRNSMCVYSIETVYAPLDCFPFIAFYISRPSSLRPDKVPFQSELIVTLKRTIQFPFPHSFALRCETLNAIISSRFECTYTVSILNRRCVLALLPWDGDRKGAAATATMVLIGARGIALPGQNVIRSIFGGAPLNYTLLDLSF